MALGIEHGGQMKTLVVYYSFDGNTRFISQKIAQEWEADILELELKREPPRGNFMKFFWAGRQVIMKDKPSLKPLYKKPEEYDLLFIGTPVWAWSYAPALETFFSENSLKGKKVAVFCCHAGSKGTTLEKMKMRLKDNQILGQVDFTEPLKKDKALVEGEVMTWAKDIKEEVSKIT